MSEPAPEPGGAPAGGGIMSRRYLGIPAVVWLAGAAILAYLYFRNRSSASSGGATSTGGGGTSTTGDIQFQPAAETIDVQGQYGPNTQTGTATTVNNPPTSGTPNPQPRPQPKPPTRVNAKNMRTYTVKKGETLKELADRYHISVACLAHHNSYVKGELPGNAKVGQTLGTGAGLKTGQVLRIPTPQDCEG